MSNQASYLVPGLWEDRKFRSLSPDAQRLMFYVWTSPTCNTEGLSRFLVHYAVADLKLSEAQVKGALRELEEVGYIRWDPEEEVVLNLLALKLLRIRNGRDMKTGEVRKDKRLRGAVRKIEGLEGSFLFAEFLKLAERDAPDLAHEIKQSFPDVDSNVTALRRKTV